MNFFIIHGVYANPEANWFPWLKKELKWALSWACLIQHLALEAA